MIFGYPVQLVQVSYHLHNIANPLLYTTLMNDVDNNSIQLCICKYCEKEKIINIDNFYYSKQREKFRLDVCRSCKRIKNQAYKQIKLLELNENFSLATKICSSCNKEKSTTIDFNPSRNICKKCISNKRIKSIRYNEKTYIAKLCTDAKYRAKQKNLDYNLYPEYFTHIPKTCPVLRHSHHPALSTVPTLHPLIGLILIKAIPQIMLSSCLTEPIP